MDNSRRQPKKARKNRVNQEAPMHLFSPERVSIPLGQEHLETATEGMKSHENGVGQEGQKLGNSYRPMTIFEDKNGTPSQLPSNSSIPSFFALIKSFKGPVIPRSPPDSAFTRRVGGRCNDAKKPIQLQKLVPDSSIIEQFYISSSAKNNKPPSHSEATEVYATLKTPFDAKLEDVRKRQMTQLQFKSDGSENITSGNPSEHPTSSECYPPMNIMDATIAQGHQPYMVSVPQNRLSCDIESLPSQCKAAICEVLHIKQMENSRCYSNQDFQQSFEGCMLDQMKKHASKSPPYPEGAYTVPIQYPPSQVQMTETLQQFNSAHPGIFSYGVILVPIGSEPSTDSIPPANSGNEKP